MPSQVVEPTKPAACDLTLPGHDGLELTEHTVEVTDGPHILSAKNISIEIQSTAGRFDLGSKLILGLHDAKTHLIGTIQIDGLSGIGVSEMLDPLFEDERRCPSRLLDPQVLRDLLMEADRVEAVVTSDLGEHVSEIVQRYSESILPGPLAKPRYRFLDLLEGNVVRPSECEWGSIRSRRSGTLRWIDIEDPKRGLLESIAKDLGLSNGTVNLCLENKQPISANGFKETLLISTKELRFDRKAGTMQLAPLTFVIGKDFIVTMHRGSSPAVDRVWSEIKRDEVIRSDLKSSNYLAARIFGSSIYAAKEAIEAMTAETEALNGRNWQPSREELVRAENLSNSARQAESVMLHLGEVVEALREKRHLFGVDHAKESLARYAAIIRGTLDQSHIVEERISDKRQSWSIEAQNVSNRYTSGLSIAIAAISVPSAIFGFFGQNFSSFPFSNAHIWLGNVVAAAASCALLAGIWYFTHPGQSRDKASH